MNLVEFHNNLRTEVTMENPSELIEQNMVIYELLKACFPSDIGIAVTNRQDSICYKISVPLVMTETTYNQDITISKLLSTPEITL